MRPFGELDDPRRRILIQALAAGFFSGAGTAAAQIFGRSPGPLPAGQSIYRVSGATVNNVAATLQTRIKPGDTVETAANGEIVFAVAEEAFLLRGGSRMVMAFRR